MKIDGSGTVRSTTVRRGERSGSARGGDFARVLGSDSDAKAPEVSGSTAIGGIDALLALQAVDSAGDWRERGKARGNGILDRLDELRVAILSGAIPRATLSEIGRLARAEREAVADPRLAEILDEIDLRAQVELAKRGA